MKDNTKRQVPEIEAYRRGFKTVALASLAFGGLAIIASACCKDVDSKMNERTEVHLKNAKEWREEEKGEQTADVEHQSNHEEKSERS